MTREILDIPITRWQAWIPVLPVLMLLGALIGQILRWVT